MSLIEAGDSAAALALIATGESNPGSVNQYGITALMFACKNKMPDVALALIATGECNPGAVNQYGITALIYACNNKMPEVALALIATEKSNPGGSNAGLTALMFACYRDMSDVAIALIDTGECNPGATNKDGNTAIVYASKNNMSDVYSLLTLIKTNGYEAYFAKKHCQDQALK